ncbi:MULTISPECIES: hypothetical protein [Phenylobacterium]|uniref:Uncharacterized protein n=1 Tax=Phenylobacterium koreense TaxID=266125 RepID=A0ABV2EFR6_9CAUL
MKPFGHRPFAIAVRAVVLATAAPAWAGTFTMAVVPDAQNYSDAMLPQPRGADTQFDTEKRKMRFYTYSTLLDRYAGRNGYLPFGTPAELSEFELDFPPQLAK